MVHVIDDDRSFLRALSRRLEAAGFDVEAFTSADDFLARESDFPGCAVVDLRLSGQSGLDLQDALARTPEPLPVIFLTGHGDVHSSVRAMKRGAVDFLTKPVAGGELIEAVRRGFALDAAARAERRYLRELRGRWERLTPRERQVFMLVAGGMLNKQIAGELGTTERTVKAHRARVMEKMRVHSVADLARAAEHLGAGLTQAQRVETPARPAVTRAVSPEPVVFWIDARDEIVRVNEAWTPFALENDAPELAAERVVGQPLWRFITDATTRQLYQDVLRVVRRGRTARFPLRCDSPEQRRQLEMIVTALPDGAVRFESVMVRAEPRADQPLWRRATPHGAGVVRACGWCKRIEAAQGWVEVESWSDALASSGEAGPPRVTHGICPGCHGDMRLLLDGLAGDAG